MTKHLTEQQQLDYIYRTLTDDQRTATDRHLASCSAYRAQLTEEQALEHRIRYRIIAQRNQATLQSQPAYAAIAFLIGGCDCSRAVGFGYSVDRRVWWCAAGNCQSAFASTIPTANSFIHGGQPERQMISSTLTPLQIPATPVSMNVVLKPAVLPVVIPIPDENLVRQFDYDQTTPLDIHEANVVANDDYVIHDIAYESPKGGRVTAHLVTPTGEGPFAGIIFLHPGGGDRKHFLDEAKKLAKMGAVSLLLDDNFSAKGEVADHDRIIRIIVDARHAVDLLMARSDVDPRRIGFVGHSHGANLGGVLTGVEHRTAAYVFMWCDAYHQLNDETEHDRAEWLREHLKLRSGPLPGENFGMRPGRSMDRQGKCYGRWL